MPITNQERAAIRRIFEKVKTELAPKIEARKRELGGQYPEKMADVIVAQNAIRVCMEVVFNECLPYDAWFCAEMATRLAAYGITAAPIEDHVALTQMVQQGLPDAVANKVRERAIMHTVWTTNGVDHPNVPSKGQVQ